MARQPKWLFGRVLVVTVALLVSLASLAPSAAAQTATTAAAPPPEATLTKRVFPDGPEPRVGGTAIFQISFTLAADRNGVVIEDTLSNAGLAPDTDVLIPNEQPPFPKSPVLFGPNNLVVEQVPFVRTTNVPNRIVYQFQLGNLKAGLHHFFYSVRFSSRLGCSTQVSNGANLRVAGIAGHLATVRTTFPLRCGPPPT